MKTEQELREEFNTFWDAQVKELNQQGGGMIDRMKILTQTLENQAVTGEQQGILRQVVAQGEGKIALLKERTFQEFKKAYKK